MSDFFVFNKTCIGYSHIKKELNCEDNSMVSIDNNNRFQIIVIADGHGSPMCFRSAKGSEFITKITVSALEEFAKNILDDDDKVILHDLKNSYKCRQERIKQLTDYILSLWSNKVKDDIKENPFTLKELEILKNSKTNKNHEHIFGTTLIASLLVDNILISIQQGDGKCNVFFGDGSIEQPIPWDERCHENVTTSVCDIDASTSIRHSIIDVNEKGGLLACCIGSDGIDDSYRNNEGTYVFYKKMMAELYKSNYDKEFFVNEYLDEFLPEFSKYNSADDISIACIIDKDKISEDIINKFNEQFDNYDLTDELLIINNKLVSMERKHRILKQLAEKQDIDTNTRISAQNDFLEYDKIYKQFLIKKQELEVESQVEDKQELEVESQVEDKQELEVESQQEKNKNLKFRVNNRKTKRKIRIKIRTRRKRKIRRKRKRKIKTRIKIRTRRKVRKIRKIRIRRIRRKSRKKIRIKIRTKVK